jgi:hypothetical protein
MGARVQTQALSAAPFVELANIWAVQVLLVVVVLVPLARIGL